MVCAPLAVANCVLAPVRGSIDCTTPGSPIATCTKPVAAIYEGDVGRAGQRPLVGHSAGGSIHFDERPVVTGHVKAIALVIDFQAVRAADRDAPVLDLAKVGKPSDKDHRRLADCEIDARRGGVGDAPARLSRQVDRMALSRIEADGFEASARWSSSPMQATIASFLAATIATPFGARPSVNTPCVFRLSASTQARLAAPRLVTSTIPSSATTPAASGKRSRVATCLLRIMVDHVDAVASSMGDENAARLRIESAMIESAAAAPGISIVAICHESHGQLAFL